MHFQVKNTCYAAIENCWAAVTATAPFCFFYINCFPYIHLKKKDNKRVYQNLDCMHKNF